MASAVPRILRRRLSILWILEWGITGAILTYLPLYFTQHGLTLDETGPVLAIGAIGLWAAPIVVGQICDRWVAAQRYLAVAHFCGGVVLLTIPAATEVYRETGAGYGLILTLFGTFAAVYLPTIPLASALTFRHLSDPKTQFGGIRVWGTVGWVLAGIGLSLWLEQREVAAWLRQMFPSTASGIYAVARRFWFLPEPNSSHCFAMAAILSFALSSFCAFLPHTPPLHTSREAGSPVGWLGSLWRQKGLTRLLVVGSLLALVIPLYSLVVPKLLEQKVARDWVPAVMTVGQLSEFPALLLLPWCLRSLGLKATFAIGIVAWIVRYALFAVMAPFPWILFGIALHGVCHVYLIIVVQLYVDGACPRDLRATAQNLFAFVTGGIAMPLGLMLTQPLVRWSTDPATGDIDFGPLFAAPTAFLACVILAFWKWFPLEEGDAADASHPASSGGGSV
ncbi:MAG: MFS transporter [Planctomyces sp.]|nr:MFS transporter [Planctomyces sp.]